jgi:hypothetical protein
MPFIIGSDINFMDDHDNMKNLITEIIKLINISPSSGLKADLPILAENTFYFCTDTQELFFGTQQGNRTVTTAAVDVTPPNEVTNLQSSNITQTSLTLTWTASDSPDIASYDVYNGATLLGNTTNTTYAVTGLTASTPYIFKVISKDTNGNASTGVTVSSTTSA